MRFWKITFGVSLLVAAAASLFPWKEGEVPRPIQSADLPPHEASLPAPIPNPEPPISATPAPARPTSVAKVVRFDDGHEVWTSLKALDPPLEERHTFEEHSFEDLAARAAQGDNEAALALYGSLRRCAEYAYDSEAKAEEAIADLESTFEYISPTGTHVSVGDIHTGPADAEAEAAIIRRATRQCSNVPQEHIDDHQSWLVMAAERGSTTAIVRLADFPPPLLEELAEPWLRAWEAGSVFHASRVSRAYEKGGFGVEQNLLQAYAYALVSSKLMDVVFVDSLGNAGPDHPIRTHEQAAVERLRSRISHFEVERATQQAKSMLSGNENCCFIPDGLFQRQASIDVAASKPAD